MSGAAPKRTRPVPGTRDRILATARVVFAEHGYAGASVRMIAREMGISDPAIHYHFPTKRSLYEALLIHPDYGSLPLAGRPLSREAMVDQVMHLFGWWIERPEFGQMLLREQLASESRSLEFMAASDEPWQDAVLAPLERLIGGEAADVSQLVYELLAGVFWDAILSFGPHFAEVVHQEYFLNRVRAMVELAIPGEKGDAMSEGDAAPVRRDDTRVRILNAARELFGSNGFDATTIKHVAERVGLTDAALYYHFRSKREILNALWEIPLGRGIANFKPGATLDDSRMDDITDATIDFTITNDHVLRLMCREILNGDQVALALRQQNRSVLRRTLREHFLTITGAEDADIRSEAVMAVITGASMKLQMESGPEFAATAATPEFRRRTQRWVRRVARLDEAADV